MFTKIFTSIQNISFFKQSDINESEDYYYTLDPYILFYNYRDEFHQTLITSNKLLYKSEWRELYVNTKNLHNLWLFSFGSNYYLNTLYYIRHKKLHKTFNIALTQTYIRHKLSTYKNNNIYWGFVSFWQAIKIWLFSLTFFSISFYTLLVKRTGVLPQTLFFWVGVSMLLYWLLSGFVFFVKKYQYSRYTSVIQRFWRRSYILFWLIESGLLLVFFYLTFNSSQESFYMFDQSYFFKTHLFSWKIFIFKSILIVSLITYSYLLLLHLKWTTFNKNILNLAIITCLLLYFVWTEFYQVYWVSNFYANFTWLYDIDESIWSLEWDARRTRIVNHYIMVLFILKFWHIIFILGCWIFFLLRSVELDTITYPLYSFNVQNFIILFIMVWLFMYPWFKFVFHWLAELPYYWFYVDTHVSFSKILINDIYLFYKSVFIYYFNMITLFSFNNVDFINFLLFDTTMNTNTFIKHTIKDLVVRALV